MLHQSAFADIVLEAAVFPVGEVGKLHRLPDIVEDHRGTQARAQAEEQHAAALVAADRLHERVVDEFHRLAEGGGEIVAIPALAEIEGIERRLVVLHRAWIAHGDDVVVQALGQILYRSDQLLRRQARPGLGAAVRPVELLSNLGAGQSPSEEAEDLGLPLGKPGGEFVVPGYRAGRP